MGEINLRRIFQPSTTTAHVVIWATLLVTASTLPHPPCAAAQTDASPPPQPKFLFNSKNFRVTLTMAIIIACLIGSLLITACVSIFLNQYCIDRQLRLTLESHGVSAPNRRRRRRLISRGLDPSVIDDFPTFAYSEVKRLKTDGISLECAVCLNEFESTDTLRLLIPICCHVFHPDCIGAWLSTHVTCPVCRSNLDTLERQTRFNSLSDDHPEPESADSVGVNDFSIADVRSMSAIERMRIGGKHLRWYSVVQEGENCERFTLRLPEEVRSRLVNSSSLSRTKSCVNLQRVRSLRKGYRSGSGGISKLGFMAATPPPKVVVMGGGEEVMATQTALVKSVRAPLHRLIWGSGSSKERFIRLTLDGEV